MENGIETRTSRIFMVIALLLTVTLFLGVFGIGGLVVYRFLAGPVEVAMPTLVDTPTPVTGGLATPTLAPLPSATPTSLSTATLVISQATATPVVEIPQSGPGQDGSVMPSPNQESAEMPETGLGSVEIVAVGLALTCLLGGARMARRMREDGRA